MANKMIEYYRDKQGFENQNRTLVGGFRSGRVEAGQQVFKNGCQLHDRLVRLKERAPV
jgi:hypothetical protein